MTPRWGSHHSQLYICLPSTTETRLIVVLLLMRLDLEARAAVEAGSGAAGLPSGGRSVLRQTGMISTAPVPSIDWLSSHNYCTGDTSLGIPLAPRIGDTARLPHGQAVWRCNNNADQYAGSAAKATASRSNNVAMHFSQKAPILLSSI